MSYSYSLAGRRVWVAGERGMVGAALARRLADEPDVQLLKSPPREGLDLEEETATREWVENNRPDVVIIAAAKVGGILANDTYPVDFLERNLLIQTNIMRASHLAGVQRLLFLGSSCIYPKFAPQPIDESALLTGPLEPTNEWYAIAKIAGIKLVQAYRKQYGLDWISAMPTNLYGPGDNFDLQSSHVLPALMRKFHEAKLDNRKFVEVWGSGSPLREFLHCDDLADALVFLLKNYSEDIHINVGSGDEISIADLATLIAEVLGCKSQTRFDSSKPDGTPRKLMNSDRLFKLGWRGARDLRSGIEQTYEHCLVNGVL
jgi:GDP-L-fucose synthase